MLGGEGALVQLKRGSVMGQWGAPSPPKKVRSQVVWNLHALPSVHMGLSPPGAPSSHQKQVNWCFCIAHGCECEVVCLCVSESPPPSPPRPWVGMKWSRMDGWNSFSQGCSVVTCCYFVGEIRHLFSTT